MPNEISLYRDRWMEMVPGDIAGSVEILEDLHDKGVPLYAITNWNGDTFRATRDRFGFLSLFRDIVVSGDEKLLKPEPAIFELLARRNGIDLTDSLFIDDSLKNVKGAEAVGMKGHHFTTPESLRADVTGAWRAVSARTECRSAERCSDFLVNSASSDGNPFLDTFSPRG